MPEIEPGKYLTETQLKAPPAGCGGCNGQFTRPLESDPLAKMHRPPFGERHRTYEIGMFIFDGTNLAQWHRRSTTNTHWYEHGPIFEVTEAGRKAMEEFRKPRVNQ